MNMFPIPASFEWVDATSVEQAASQLAQTKGDRRVVAKAGGQDLLDWLKEGLVRPARVVNLKSIPGLDGIDAGDFQGLRLGALVTLAQIESHGRIRERFPALADAAGHAATPQVRNAATIGGNLLQKPRCWYLRSSAFADAREEPARDGENQFHAIFDNRDTTLVHASTPATALVAYGASVELTDAGGATRTLPLADFLVPPVWGKARDAATAIRDGEVLTRVTVPAPIGGTRSAYHKQTERDSYDWPICDVAVVLPMAGDRVAGEPRVVMGWVAPTPKRATEAERLLAGKAITEDLAREAARAAVAGATPLSKNGYKVPVLEAVVRRTILAAAKV